MKHFKSTLALFSLAILLVGCTANNAISSPNTTSSSQTSASKVPASSSVDGNKVYFTGQTAIDIGKMISLLGSPYNSIFKLEEFGDKEFAASGVSGDNNHVDFYYDGQKIIEKMNNNICFASDVNNDGYRDIVTLIDRDTLVVYDVKNNKKMFHQALHGDEIPTLHNPKNCYYYRLLIKDDDLVLVIYDGSGNMGYYDYAKFTYNTQANALEFDLQNMFDIDNMKYVSVYQGDRQVNLDSNSAFALVKGVEYTINFQINRKANPDLSKVIETFETKKEVLSYTGVYFTFLNQQLVSYQKNLRCSNSNYFGDYQAKFTVRENSDLASEGTIRIGFVGFNIDLVYKLAE